MHVILCKSVYTSAMHIETVPNRNSTPTILLRETYRDVGAVRKLTLFNLTHWPVETREGGVDVAACLCWSIIDRMATSEVY